MNDFDPTETEAEDVLELDLGDQPEKQQFKEGDYEFIVDSYSIAPAKSSGDKQITWVLRFPSVNNWTIKHYTGLTHTRIWSTEQIVVALGLAKAGEKMVLDKRKTIGRRAMAKIVLEQGQDGDRMWPKVKKVFPHKDGPVDPNALTF
jgi:hypothetical protein